MVSCSCCTVAFVKQLGHSLAKVAVASALGCLSCRMWSIEHGNSAAAASARCCERFAGPAATVCVLQGSCTRTDATMLRSCDRTELWLEPLQSQAAHHAGKHGQHRLVMCMACRCHLASTKGNILLANWYCQVPFMMCCVTCRQPVSVDHVQGKPENT